jgi:hypothetical protein
MGWRILVNFIRQPMTKLKTHSDFHDLFLKYSFGLTTYHVFVIATDSWEEEDRVLGCRNISHLCGKFRLFSRGGSERRMKDYASGAGTAYPSGAPGFNPVFSGVRVTRPLVLCVCFVGLCLSICPFSFGHCAVCPSSIYGF